MTPKLKHIFFTISLCVGLFPFCTVGQLFTSDNVVVTNNAATITINGDVQIQNSAMFNNSGVLVVDGNWVNNSGTAGFVSPTGSVQFKSGSPQNIGGSSSTSFFTLEFLPGTGIVSLFQSISVGGFGASTTGVLNKNSRHLNLNTQTLTIENALPSAITGTGFIISETDPSFGYGIVDWKIRNTAPPATYTIPFGSSSLFSIPLTISLSTGGVGANGSLRIATYPTNTSANPNNRPLPTGVPMLTNGSGTDNSDKVLDRFWIINSANYSTNPTSAITFTYLDNEHNTGNNSIVELNLQMQRTGGSNWSFPAIGSVNVVSNTVSVSGVNTYDFAWVAVDNSVPLPVELLSFDAIPFNQKEVLCKWVTASEKNSSHFEVERSFDGHVFDFIGTVKAEGFSTVSQHYSLTDPHPQTGVNYYRLKQFDLDGSFEYSSIVMVRFNPLFQHQITLYPNPASSMVYVHISGEIEAYSTNMILYDATGRTIRAAAMKNVLSEGQNTFLLSLEELAPAVYTLVIESNHGRSVAHLVVQQ